MTIKYNGKVLNGEALEAIKELADNLKCPLLFLIVQLYYESYWGNSAVGKADNNWAGMTFPSGCSYDSFTRPSGVQVTRGLKRPAREGGHYMHYQSVGDFIKDWGYLLRQGGSYQVAGAATVKDATRGLFRVGGARYDYATCNIPENDPNASSKRFQSYYSGIKALSDAMIRENGSYLTDQVKGANTMPKTAVNLVNFAKKWIGSAKWGSNHQYIVNAYNKIRPLPRGYAVKYSDDWCDTFVSFVAHQTGYYDLIGAECGVERHKDIFKSKGIWKGRVKPQVGDIVIFNWSGNPNSWGNHIGIVAGVSGSQITTIEGNTSTATNGSIVAYKTYAYNSVYIQGYARPRYNDGEQKIKDQPKVNRSVGELARDVIAGKLGNGNQRKAILGDQYEEVQKEVNRLLSGGQDAPALIDKKKKEALKKLESTITDQDKNLIAQKILNLVKVEDITRVINEVLEK